MILLLQESLAVYTNTHSLTHTCIGVFYCLFISNVYVDAAPVSTVRSQYANMKPVADDLTLHPVDDIVRRLCRLCWIVNKPSVTGKLIQLGIQIGGDNVGMIKDNLYLNQVPHNRYVRQYFYGMAANAVFDAVVLCSKGRITNRMQLNSMFPEMNPSMDSYRYAR
jgi:hypothetical protein